MSEKKASCSASQVILWNIWHLTLFSHPFACETETSAPSWLRIWRLHPANINLPQWAPAANSGHTVPFHKPERQYAVSIGGNITYHSAIASSKHWLLRLSKHPCLLQLRFLFKKWNGSEFLLWINPIRKQTNNNKKDAPQQPQGRKKKKKKKKGFIEVYRDTCCFLGNNHCCSSI